MGLDRHSEASVSSAFQGRGRACRTFAKCQDPHNNLSFFCLLGIGHAATREPGRGPKQSTRAELRHCEWKTADDLPRAKARISTSYRSKMLLTADSEMCWYRASAYVVGKSYVSSSTLWPAAWLYGCHSNISWSALLASILMLPAKSVLMAHMLVWSNRNMK